MRSLSHSEQRRTEQNRTEQQNKISTSSNYDDDEEQNALFLYAMRCEKINKICYIS